MERATEENEQLSKSVNSRIGADEQNANTTVCDADTIRSCTSFQYPYTHYTNTPREREATTARLINGNVDVRQRNI